MSDDERETGEAAAPPPGEAAPAAPVWSRHQRLRARRRERLLSRLPRIFAAQPAGSAIAALLDALAGRLAELDESTEAALRDRWIALAGGAPVGSAEPAPLDRLGALLGIAAEPWEEHEGDVEPFRRRLRASAPVVIQGTASARALLTLAAAALDAELCPRLTRDRDTTLAIGVAPGTLAGCKACATPGAPCPYAAVPPGRRSPIIARLELTDSPVTRVRRLFAAVRPGDPIVFASASHHADRPTIEITAREPIAYPALRSRDSDHVVLFAGALAAGETLILRPNRADDEVAPFGGHGIREDLGGPLDGIGHVAIARDGRIREVDRNRVLYMRSETFGDATPKARFGPGPRGARFAVLSLGPVPPRIEPGENHWTLTTYVKEELLAACRPDPQNPSDPLHAIVRDAPTSRVVGAVDVSLAWWARRPASLQLRVPLQPVATKPEERTLRQQLVRRVIAEACALGVTTSIDFPEPPREEQHGALMSERLVALALKVPETQTMHEGTLHLATSPSVERQPADDARLGIRGVFDVTRLGWSRFSR